MFLKSLITSSKLNYAFNTVELMKSALCANKIRLFSTDKSISYSSTNSDDGSSKILLTEDLPPKEPNYGFRGDQPVIKAIQEIKRIRESFNYGNPPRIRKRNYLGPKVIRLVPLQTCNNRRFYRLVVTRERHMPRDPFIEDLGSFDPMPNRDNSLLCALNLERIKYYLSIGVPLRGQAGVLLGLAGFLPVSPASYLKAYRNRKLLNESANEKKEEKAVE